MQQQIYKMDRRTPPKTRQQCIGYTLPNICGVLETLRDEGRMNEKVEIDVSKMEIILIGRSTREAEEGLS